MLPYVQQMNYGALKGAIAAYNPNALAQLDVWVNEEIRKIYDMRTWYGLYTRGQIVCPAATTGGTATVTLGSQTVTGANTSWTQALVGQQLRLGLNTPPYTIIQVSPLTTPQTLTLDLPWGGPFPPNQTTMTAGYTILQMYYSLGPNIKYIKQVVNFQMGFKLWLNLTQDFLDNYDAWRTWQNFPWAVAPLSADPNGNYRVELWPAPITQQVLPWYAYTQPPNLVKDSDSLPPYIRCDLVVDKCIARALRYKPKDIPGYDPQTALAVANDFDQKFRIELQDMINADENLYRINATIPGEDLPLFTPSGALWDAMHAVMAATGGDDGW